MFCHHTLNEDQLQAQIKEAISSSVTACGTCAGGDDNELVDHSLLSGHQFWLLVTEGEQSEQSNNYCLCGLSLAAKVTDASLERCSWGY